MRLHTSDWAVKLTVVRFEEEFHVEGQRVQAVLVVDVADGALVVTFAFSVADDHALDAFEESHDTLEAGVCRQRPIAINSDC